MTESVSYRWRINQLLPGAGLAISGLFTSPAAMAWDDVMDTLQMHGFLSQAWIISDTNDFFGPSSDGGGSFQYTELGINASLRPHRDILLAAQMLSRQAGKDSDASPNLDYGLIDYQMFSNQQRTLGLQAGRIKNPFGFYNQTRDVAFTRPSILLPQSIYFDRTRSLGLAGDGASLYLEERLPIGTIYAQASFGQAQVGDDAQRTLRLGETRGELDEGTSAIGQIRYEHHGGQFVAALSTGRATADFDSRPGGPGNGRFRFQPTVLSLQYNEEFWSLTAEYALRELSLQGFDNFRNFDTTGESWYLQYTRRFHDDWQWLLRYDKLVNDREDPSGRAYEASGAGPAYSQYAEDITLGLQWAVHPQVMLAAEYHHIDGTGWLPVETNTGSWDSQRRWQLLLLQLSLRF